MSFLLYLYLYLLEVTVQDDYKAELTACIAQH